MAYYEDLSPYNYHHYSEKELNVGWLQKDQKFNVGEVPEGFIEKLNLYFTKNNTVFHCRGDHDCDFCDNCGSASCKIRVVSSDGKVYASPELIKHYIEMHHYLPPQDFIDAVMSGPVPGSTEYDNIIKRMPEYWKRREPDQNDENYEEKITKMMVDEISQSVDNKIFNDLLNENPEMKKFIESYSKVMPAVYGMKNKNKKSE